MSAATDKAAPREIGGGMMPPPAPSPVAPRLKLSGLRKSFGGSHALKGVDLEVRAGEIHGLLGENGSGKSTLIKILNAFHQPDAGTLEVDGRPVDLPLAPGRFQDLGLSFVHQDLGLIRELTVLENLRLVEWGSAHDLALSARKERERANRIFEEYGLSHLDPDSALTSISETDAALLAIVRSVMGIADSGGGLLVLDEPTVFLPREGITRLFDMVRTVAARGVSVLFVSHDIDEVLELTDAVTVLRDGAVFGNARTADMDKAGLVEMIIGRHLAEAAPLRDRGRQAQARGGASVRGLRGPRLRGIDFELNDGEILGLTGLMGSGFEDVPYSLFGAKPVSEGVLARDGRTTDLTRLSPGAALKSGMALLPSDRQRDGALGGVSVLDNLMMQVMQGYRPWRLDNRRMTERANELLEEFDVRPRDPDAVFGALSGGNQQKVLLAKWLEAKPGILLLHEPTQGVDIGAREQIFELLGRAAENGLAVVCASSDSEQLAQICDRVLIIARGEVSREMSGAELTKEEISSQVLQSVTLSEMEQFQEEAM
ncbi:MAG: sugar ABC transporter ATP-binding protein [Solirubrobacterales bacterium]|nr:sugar ABC transporter ATP-binding protein [Solirubrobacterales bacterium]